MAARNARLKRQLSKLASVNVEVQDKLAGLYADALSVETANARLRSDNAAMRHVLAPYMPLLQRVQHEELVHQVMDCASGRAYC